MLCNKETIYVILYTRLRIAVLLDIRKLLENVAFAELMIDGTDCGTYVYDFKRIIAGSYAFTNKLYFML